MKAQLLRKTAVLIVAAGRGERAGGDIPKQYRQIDGHSVLGRAIDSFLDHPAISRIQPVIGSGDEEIFRQAVPSHARLLPPVSGASTRQGSVLRGLRSLAADAPDQVLIHDGARPFLGKIIISRVLDGLAHATGVIPALPIASTVKKIDPSGWIIETVPREGLVAAETPQGFRFADILAAHERAAAEGKEFTDDAAVAEWAGMSVATVAGDVSNIKLTTAEEISAAEHRLAGESALALGDVRVGNGFDVHTFGPGDHVMLGGVAIPHDRGVVGHSDADVALHALTDAILGALADGDIGVHFPPSDPRWKGAASEIFLAEAVRRLRARGGRIAHLDLAIIAEAPKVGPYRDAIRQRIAEIAGITLDRVSIKATTNEGLGYIGRREGIAAHATATIRLPFGIE